MGERVCYREFCPDCDAPLTVADESCPDCGTERLDSSAESG